jgi:hypothetical protein
MHRYEEVKKQVEIAQINLAAAQDTIRITKAKNNELEYNKRVYVASTKKQLKALSDSLARQVELTKGDVVAIENIGFRVKHDTVSVPTTVYEVTNLNDDNNPGSLRYALSQTAAYRTVIFRVSGTIHLTSRLNIKANTTVAGQTAPGDGICIAGESVWIDTHDVVIRYMRFRRGATEVTRRDDALGGNPVGNIMIDHVSASWGLDENMSMYRHVYDRGGTKQEKLPTVNVSIQNSIFSECLDTYNHAFGSTIGGLNSTFVRNLWANNISRNPSVGMYGDFGFVNNVVFQYATPDRTDGAAAVKIG